MGTLHPPVKVNGTKAITSTFHEVNPPKKSHQPSSHLTLISTKKTKNIPSSHPHLTQDKKCKLPPLPLGPSLRVVFSPRKDDDRSIAGKNPTTIHPHHHHPHLKSPNPPSHRTSWLEQLLTNAFCPACRESAPPGVLKASELDLSWQG